MISEVFKEGVGGGAGMGESEGEENKLFLRQFLEKANREILKGVANQKSRSYEGLEIEINAITWST